MSPDSPETRLGRLETAVARLEQRTDDLSTDVRTLTPLVIKVAEIGVTIAQVQTETHAIKTAIEARRENERKDARSLRNILVGVGVTAFLSPIGAIIVAVVVNRP
jgi:uncharacterized protein YoxC